MALPVFKSVSTQATEDDNTGTTVVVNFCSNVCGDFLIAIISPSNGTPNLNPAALISPPCGWTELIEASTGAATAQSVYFAYRFSTGCITSATFTAACGPCCTGTGYISNGVIYTGVCCMTPIDVSAIGCAISGTTTNTAPRPTTTKMCDMILRWMTRDGTVVAITHPACTTERIDAGQAGPGNGVTTNFTCEGQMCTGLTACRQWSWTGGEESRSATVAIAPVQCFFQISGDVRDLSLCTVGTVRVVLLKHDGAAEASRIYSVIAHANANACGLYNFMCIGDNDARYTVMAYNDEATDRRGVTIDGLTPVACP